MSGPRGRLLHGPLEDALVERLADRMEHDLVESILA